MKAKKEIDLPLTKAQSDYLQPLVNEAGRLRDQIKQFLHYVGAEAGLPSPPPQGWDLKISKDGQTASLVGAVEIEAKEN